MTTTDTSTRGCTCSPGPEGHYPGELLRFFERIRNSVGMDGNDCEMVANEIERRSAEGGDVAQGGCAGPFMPAEGYAVLYGPLQCEQHGTDCTAVEVWESWLKHGPLDVARLRARIAELERAHDAQLSGYAALGETVCAMFETTSTRSATISLHRLVRMLDRTALALSVEGWATNTDLLAARIDIAIKLAKWAANPDGCIDRALSMLQVERGVLRPALASTCSDVIGLLEDARRLLVDQRGVEREIERGREVAP